MSTVHGEVVFGTMKRTRKDFSKIKTAVRIPNLTEIQRESYHRFLQMDLLPEERENVGLQAVFRSVFPITDFRNTAQLDFISYSIGEWRCKCGRLEGLNYLRSKCRNCGATIRVNPLSSDDVLCDKCGAFNRNVVRLCDTCGEPVGLKLKYDVHECQERGMTYSVPLKVNIRLTVWNKDEATGRKSIHDMKENEVYFGEIPLMTENSTFIINGTERVIVSQLHRSPGVFFEKGAVYTAKIIPYRGSWVDFEYDSKNLLYVRIDRKRKFLATTFLRALGLVMTLDIDKWRNNEISESEFEDAVKLSTYTDSAILRTFYNTNKVYVKNRKFYLAVAPSVQDFKVSKAVTDPKTGEVLLRAGRKISAIALEKFKNAGITMIEIDASDLEGAYVVEDIVDRETSEVLVESNEPLGAKEYAKILETTVNSFEVFFPERDDVGVVISQTLKKDTVKFPREALLEIYRKMRPGDPPTISTAWNLFYGMFFDERKFDFSKVGRLKFNIKMGRPERERLDEQILSPADFFDVIKYLLRLKKNIGEADDIDHLGNRRVRAVGELLENQFRVGLVRMERAIKEKMSIHQEMRTAMPRDLINAKPVTAAIREFFGSSQLSQFMDQTNPLSEITHKRRLSALGPGGLSRERAGFEVRDVHPTHYGRICPIETPEGPNIGLISSLSCFARINEFGFIESPYRKVENGKVVDYYKVINSGSTDLKIGEHVSQMRLDAANAAAIAKGGRPAEAEPHPFYLSAWEEDRYTIAQANIELDAEGRIINERVAARKAGNFVLAHRDEIQFIDVSPKQLVSVAASLIPFLENDDANRALMGSNMQRQAVPLLRAEAPFVGTGMEKVTAQDSGAVVVARRDGVVDSVDSERIIIRVDHKQDGSLSREVTADIYQLVKFKRSNQNTCINQKPIVSVGQRVKKGEVIADGPCTDMGELALGRNVLVAFMPWRGYNFEDAILVSEKLVKEDAYTSIHIEELEIEARDTKLGPEEITRDIPNVSESMLRDLDDSGIIRIGAHVKPGSILVGKVTPKGETQLTPEEKLLRAIFGEKAGDVRDASLTCPPGIEGIVVDVKVFTRKGAEKDKRSLAIEAAEEAKLRKNLADEVRILQEERDKRIYELLRGQKLAKDLKVNQEETIARRGEELTPQKLKGLTLDILKKIELQSQKIDVAAEISELEARTDRQISILRQFYEERIEKLKKGDELPPGVIKMVKVFIAMKRKLSVGDKMAGRHGNKGVIAQILPEEDMPFLADGTPVEIVLNPLGVPSRMNVGQILETHLGYAAKVLGLHFATPVFDGATEKEIKQMLELAKLPTSGKQILYDGLTGEPFEQQVTVGYIYMMKLSHLVDDKIHARSIGPYSLITQQPLGGKAQFGGQRFGEMEVWALEAYGAAHILQELLTAKSDDVAGRSKIYEAIVKGESDFDPGLPESFNVLIRELQSLCLDVELIKKSDY
ncbi:MAG: DNA-directed RNA polymerase subunit beta [Acidobacteriota bacterium]|nr:DNA-directed RNA polymerase subunit beta [Blastocatellia bacterium]MDW8413409.1 DNA-directed RNA polymerase subunit beta [Acidobacteriota bacterium]